MGESYEVAHANARRKNPKIFSDLDKLTEIRKARIAAHDSRPYENRYDEQNHLVDMDEQARIDLLSANVSSIISERMRARTTELLEKSTGKVYEMFLADIPAVFGVWVEA
jgi:hypothetical protein